MLLLTDQTLKRQMERQWSDAPLRSAHSYVGWTLNDGLLVACSFRRVPRWRRKAFEYGFPALRWRRASVQSERAMAVKRAAVLAGVTIS